MSNPYKLTVTLRQHTPLLHFQSDQAGATLRASEVKPKLDRFLTSLRSLPINPDWQMERGYADDAPRHDVALDYKLAVRMTPGTVKMERVTLNPMQKNGKWVTDDFKLVLANMGGKEYKDELKDLVLYRNSQNTGEFQLVFQSFYPDLLTTIRERLPDFLSRNNFGNRQSKGFGSFYLHEADPAYRAPMGDYQFTLSVENGDRLEVYKTLFENIETFWKALRGGINDYGGGGRPIFYFKSLLFSYARYNGIQWDKKSIKNHFFAAELGDQQADHAASKDGTETLWYGSETQFLMKDLLGLSSREEWKLPYKAVIEKEHLKNDNNTYRPYSDSDPDKDDAIVRFMSPVVFKPIRENNRFRIYITVNPVPSAFRGQHFGISASNSNQPLLDLQTPADDLVSAKKYLKFLFGDDFDLETHVQIQVRETPKYQDSPKYKLIKGIIDEINRHLNP